MIVLPNVLIDVYRSSYSVNGGTDTPQPHLTNVVAHLSRIQGAVLKPSPNGGMLYAQYQLNVDITIDIQRADLVKNIRRLDNKKLWFAPNDFQEWRVIDANNASIGFLEYRDVELTRFVSGGGFNSGL
jgi:hypothetical protein